jgi:hypothetical protein
MELRNRLLWSRYVVCSGIENDVFAHVQHSYLTHMLLLLLSLKQVLVQLV